MKVKPVYHGETKQLLGHAVWCPACQHPHVFDNDTRRPGAGWTFNGDVNRPTFSPSMLSTSGHFMSQHKPGEPCWCEWNKEHPGEEAPFKCRRCHSFVTDGQIQFLADCSHEMRGTTMELPEYPENR